MFSRWVVTNITPVRGTVNFRNPRIPCGDQLVICGHYPASVLVTCFVENCRCSDSVLTDSIATGI
jgi:hypothetical protein